MHSHTDQFRRVNLPKGKAAEQRFEQFADGRGWGRTRTGVYDDATFKAAVTEADRLAPDYWIEGADGMKFHAEVKSTDSIARDEYTHLMTLDRDTPVGVFVVQPDGVYVTRVSAIAWVPWDGQPWRPGSDRGSGKIWGKLDLTRCQRLLPN